MAGNPSASCSPRAAAIVAALCAVAVLSSGQGSPGAPWLDRVEPLGGQVGTSVEVALAGRHLGLPAGLEFDSPHLRAGPASAGSDGGLLAAVHISANAPPGPHIATLRTPRGRSNSRLFYVHETSAGRETEPNDTLPQAQPVELRPQTLHGMMPEIRDIDVFRFEARAGERWTFDLRSLEYGGFLENNLALLDADGRQVAFSDDRDDYLETPFVEHRFARSGTHYLRLDQYRGPQRVNCDENCGYMLRVGQLPVVEGAFPLGARQGSDVSLTLAGRGLADVERVWLRPVRRAEYYRMTFPHTIPVRVGDPAGVVVEALVSDRSEDSLTAAFSLPADAPAGLWRIWVRAPGGIDDSLSFVVSGHDEPPDCSQIRPVARGTACTGLLRAGAGRNEHWLDLAAGEDVVVTTLAAQLGLPRIDTVLELFDSQGAPLAEHDDLMSGQGTVIGNPDSFLHWRSERGGRYRLVVSDRIGRTGPDMAYRLHVERREPRFGLLSDPENLNVEAGRTLRLGVLMTPEPGFRRAVDVWLEDPPAGISAGPAAFREDQYFGPSGDADNVLIPTAFLDIAVGADLSPGDYDLRILGRAAGREWTVQAISTLWIGPPTKRNDVRRPVESVRLTVLDPGTTPGSPPRERAPAAGSR